MDGQRKQHPCNFVISQNPASFIARALCTMQNRPEARVFKMAHCQAESFGMLKFYITGFGDLLSGCLDQASAPKTSRRQRTELAFGDLLLSCLDQASAPKTRCRQRTKSESWHPSLRLLILYRAISTGPVDGAHAVHGADGGTDEGGTEEEVDGADIYIKI